MGWWPDWKGETVVVAAAGPSMAAIDLGLARGKARVVAVKRTWEKAPWADAVYGCDWHWWAHRGPTASQFPGLRIIGDLPSKTLRDALTPAQVEFLGKLKFVGVKSGVGPMIWTGHEIRGGGNSAFQAVNLVARWGARRIVLAGVDCDAPNSHWHGPHDHPNNGKQSTDTLKIWLAQWEQSVPEFRARGIEVVNCSKVSKVAGFDRMDFGEALAA